MNIYEIRVQGRLDSSWSMWFEGLTISYEDENVTVLRGPLVDESALYGVLAKVRNLVVPLLSVSRIEEKNRSDSSCSSCPAGKDEKEWRDGTEA